MKLENWGSGSKTRDDKKMSRLPQIYMYIYFYFLFLFIFKMSMVVFDNLGLVCQFLTWREGGFHGFLILGFGMSLVYGEKMPRLGF
jgi:hypothetical protein